MKIISRYSPYAVVLLLIAILIAAIYYRDLPNKPIIDVIITSISSILSAIIAAFVAYQVAKLQIENSKKSISFDRKKKYISSLKLLLHELSYNKDILLEANQDAPKAGEDASDIEQFLSINLHITIWEKVMITLVEETESNFFNQIADLYYKIGVLKQEKTFTIELLTTTISDTITVYTQLESLIETSTSN